MKKLLIPIVISSLLILFSLLYSLGDSEVNNTREVLESDNDVVFYIPWGDKGVNLVDTGVVDIESILRIYNSDLSKGYVKDFFTKEVEMIPVTVDNSAVVLNTLWAFGLSNKSRVLEEGPMTQYGSSGRFASTGGWTLSKGNVMDHYSAHSFISLTDKQQDMVDRVSKNIFRPCCNNSTFFPDCNHGMAMLGLLEIFAFNDFSEAQLYEVALKANKLWFGSMYDSIITYLKDHKGLSDDEITPKLLLSRELSSSSGYQTVLESVESKGSSSSCSV